MSANQDQQVLEINDEFVTGRSDEREAVRIQHKELDSELEFRVRQEDILVEMGIPNLRFINMNNPIHVSSLIKLIDSGRTVDVAVNGCHGGFGLSKVAAQMYISAVTGTARANHAVYISQNYDTGVDMVCLAYDNIERHDPKLIKVINNYGKRSNGTYASLVIKQIPSYLVSYYSLHEYDGIESVCKNIDTFKRDMIRKISLAATYESMRTSMELIEKIQAL